MVNIQKVIVLLAFTCCIVAKNQNNINQKQGYAGDYDLYIFSAEVPGSVCNHKHCKPEMLGNLPAKGINMHGLWPQNNDGSYPEFCSTETYDEKKLTDETLARLDTMWNGLYNSTFWFRTHEYNKHGTCYQQQKQSNNILNFLAVDNNNENNETNHQEQFFKTVIEVYDRIDLNSIVYSQDTFSLKELDRLVQEKYKVTKYDLECEMNNGQQELFAIYVCLDLDLQLIDCPMSFLRNWHVQKRCKDNNDIVIRPLVRQEEQ